MVWWPLVALIKGVTNSLRNPWYLIKDGQKWWMKFIINPFICDPSESWSVIIITLPYLKDFRSLYYLSFYNPMIFIKFSISSFSIIYFADASRTFSNLPLNGNIPYLSLPTTSIPDMANDLAESPSVKINVHNSEFLLPASLASSNFSIPCNLDCLFPFRCLLNLASYFALA